MGNNSIIKTTHKTTHATSRGTWWNLPGSLPVFQWRSLGTRLCVSVYVCVCACVCVLCALCTCTVHTHGIQLKMYMCTVEASSCRWSHKLQTIQLSKECLQCTKQTKPQKEDSQWILPGARSTAIPLPYIQSIWEFPWESLQKIWRSIKCHSGKSIELTWQISTEWVSSQTSKSCLCKLSSPSLCTYSLY